MIAKPTPPLESDIERKACALIKRALNVASIKVNTVTETGWPDRLFLIPGGVPLFIEFKRPGGKLSRKQAWIHEQLRSAGYAVETHTTVEGAVAAVQQRCCPW